MLTLLRFNKKSSKNQILEDDDNTEGPQTDGPRGGNGGNGGNDDGPRGGNGGNGGDNTLTDNPLTRGLGDGLDVVGNTAGGAANAVGNAAEGAANTVTGGDSEGPQDPPCAEDDEECWESLPNDELPPPPCAEDDDDCWA